MRLMIHKFAAASSTFGLMVSGALCLAQETDVDRLQQRVAELERKNLILQRNLIESNRVEKEASEQLLQVRERLEALGKNLFDGGDDRLIQAAADLQIAHERLADVQRASNQLVSNVSDYISKAVVSDPDARLRVETSMRELDEALGLRQKPRPDIRSGSLQQARIVSIDSESGMIVLNIGEEQGTRIGMAFRLTRGSAPYGKAIVSDVRKGVCGLFVDSLENEANSPKVGDQALLETKSYR